MSKLLKYISIAFVLMIFSSSILYGQNEFDSKVKFDKTIHNFGDILISDGEQKCSFTMTNISNAPIVIHKVISSCGCTEPDWTKHPIKPGGKGEINVTFKNDQGPYPFNKSITVYISDMEKPIMLRIKGTAHEKKKDLKELYTFRLGPLGLRDEILDIGQISQGFSREESVEIANISSRPVKVSFTNASPGLSLSIEPNPIAPNSKAILTYVINTQSMRTKEWGKSIFSTDVTDGTKKIGKLSIETLIKDDFSQYTEEQRRKGALPSFTKSSESFGTVTKGTKPIITFSCKNLGKEELKIHKIDVSEKGVDVKFPSVISAGNEGNLIITIDTSKQEGELLYIFTIITNSPSRPIVNLFITGNIE